MATDAGLAIAWKLWGWRPHSRGQREYMTSDAPVKVAACGRRWGKSESTAIDIVLYALEHPSTIQMVIAPTDDQTDIIFSETARRFRAIDGLPTRMAVRTSPYRSIALPGLNHGDTATIIMARTAGSDGKGIRGRKAHRVIVDEAAFVPDSVMDDVITPLLADYDGDLVLISTPSGRNHFWRAFQRGQDGLQPRYRSFQFPSRDNPYLSRDYLDNEYATKPTRVWRIEYLAEFADAEGQVFRNVDACCDGVWLDWTRGETYAAGLDLARIDDFSVLSIIARSTRRLVYQDRFNRIDWPLQVARVTAALRRYGNATVLVETNSIGDVIADQLRRAGANVHEFVTTASTKPDLIDGLATAFEDMSIRLPSRSECAVLVNELEAYAYQRTPAGYVRMSAPEGEHDDTVMSLALAWRQASIPQGATLAGPARWSKETMPEKPIEAPRSNPFPAVRRVPATVGASRFGGYVPR